MKHRSPFVLILLFVSFSSIAQWTPTNGPYGGYTKDIVKVGNALFIIGTGGVHKSTDNGSTWTQINSGLPANTNITSIGADGTAILAGTQGKGLYRSEDNGATWRAEGRELGVDLFVNKIFVEGTDIYIQANNQSFYSSFNHGNYVKHTGDLKELLIDKMLVNNGKLYANTGTGLYVSPDKGATWSKIDAIGNWAHTLVASGNTIYAVSSYPLGMVVSTNGGASWDVRTFDQNLVSDAEYTAYYDMTAWAEGDELYVARSGGAMIYSPNKGVDFEIKKHRQLYNYHYGMVKDNSGIYLATSAGVVFSSDKGTTWERKNNGAMNETFASMVNIGSSVFVSTSEGVYKTTDSGTTWNRIMNGIPEDVGGWLHAGPNALFLCLGKSIYTSVNLGDSWTRKYDFTLGVNQQVQSFAGDAARLVAGVNALGAYVSKNNGDTWTLTTHPSFETNTPTVTYVKGDTIMMGNFGHVVATKNFGTTWQEVTPITEYFFTFGLNYANKKFVIVAFQGIYISDSPTGPWTFVPSDLTTDNFGNVIQDAPNKLYAGTPKGVYVSYNTGLKWLPVNIGMENKPVSLQKIAGNTFYAGVQQGVIWKNATDKVNVKPKITSLKHSLTTNEGTAITIGASDLNIEDPDDDYPQDFTVMVANGDKFTVSNGTVTPKIDSRGDLSISLKVNDGHSDSDVFDAKITIILGLGDGVVKSIIYPNPASQFIYINGKVSRYAILDMQGRSMTTGEGGDKETLIDIQAFSSGIYLIKLEENGETAVHRFWKK